MWELPKLSIEYTAITVRIYQIVYKINYLKLFSGNEISNAAVQNEQNN